MMAAGYLAGAFVTALVLVAVQAKAEQRDGYSQDADDWMRYSLWGIAAGAVWPLAAIVLGYLGLIVGLSWLLFRKRDTP